MGGLVVPRKGEAIMSLNPPGRPDAPGRRILLVEDNEDNRESLKLLLSLLGHCVTVAADGIDGVRQALRTRPELAIIDIGLPGLDGCQVARRVRNALGREVVLVAYTPTIPRTWEPGCAKRDSMAKWSSRRTSRRSLPGCLPHPLPGLHSPVPWAGQTDSCKLPSLPREKTPSRFLSFPSSAWERTGAKLRLRPVPAWDGKQSFPTCIPKQSLGTRSNLLLAEGSPTPSRSFPRRCTSSFPNTLLA